jgi:outer membrane receptor protein involved in Fe transport
MNPRAFALLLLTIFLLLPNAVLAQPAGGTITGVVLDGEDGNTLRSATVTLLNARGQFMTGTTTGDDGSFRLTEIQPGRYGIRISFIGYLTRNVENFVVVPGQTANLGQIRLEVDTATLDEIVVAARRELVEQRADRTIYNVADQPVTAGGSALETLQTLPSIEVDTEGNLSLRGSQNVAVHIDGRPVPVRGAMLASMLRQISAQNVERVEVLPNPSARYEPDGMSGIINIVLKEGTNRGLSGGLTTGMGTAPNGEVSANLAYQQGRWDLFGSYGFRYDAFQLDGESLQTRLAIDQTIQQDVLIDNGTGSHLFNTTVDYTLAPGTTIGARSTIGRRAGTSDQTVNYLFGPAPAPDRFDTRLTDGTVGGLNFDAAMTFRRQFGEDHLLKAETRITRNADERAETFTYQMLAASLPGRLERSTVDNATESQVAQIDYNRTIGGVRVETGTRLSQRRIDNNRLFERQADGAYIPVPGRSADFGFDESIYAGYLQANRSFGKLDFQAGLRGEISERTIDVLATGRSSNRFDAIYPSAFALYNFAPGTSVKAGYSRRVNRPQASALNPVPQFDDALIVDRGNPDLRPEYIDAVEFTFQFMYAINVSPFYRRTTDVIRRRVFFDPATGITTLTSQNLDVATTYGTDVTLLGQFGPVRGMVSGSAYRAVTDGGSAETGVMSDAFIWSLRSGIQIRPREGTEVQLFGFYRAPTKTEDGRISGFAVTSIGVRQQLIRERLSLSARLNDVLNTTRFEFRTSNGHQIFQGTRDPRIQHVTASLTYTFGQTTPRQRQAPTQVPAIPMDNISY